MDVNRFFEEAANPLNKWDEWKAQNAAKSTPELYQAGLDFFMRFNRLESYEELYQVQLEAQRRGTVDPLSRYVVQEMIRKAVAHRINVDGVSGSHAKAIKSGVVKFMQLCGFEDFTAKLPRGTNKANSNGGSDIITPQQLRTVLEVADDLMKHALVLTLKDSGLRLGDVLSLDIGDVAGAVDSKQDFFYLNRLTQKTGDRAQTVLGPESLKALRAWVRYRRDRGESLSSDTPLFITYRLKSGPKAKVEHDANMAIRSEFRISPNAATNVVSRIFSKAGFSTVTAHGLRKTHSTYLGVGEDRLSEPMIARLEGKVIQDSREPYKVYSEDDLVEAYSRNYHQIQVYSTESNTVKQLTTKNEELRKSIEPMQEKIDELEGLRKQMDEMQKSLEIINKRDTERRIFEKKKEA